MTVIEHDGVIWIRHVGKGTGVLAQRSCQQVRELLERATGPRCVVHDATFLDTVDDEYVKAYMQLEKARGQRIAVTYAIIPNLWLRTLAKAVGAISPGRWSFHSTAAEVHVLLAARGVRTLGSSPLPQTVDSPPS